MKGFSGDPSGDPDELAIKFLALTIFHGASQKAREVSLQRSEDGKVSFAIHTRETSQLPAPSAELADRAISIARAVTHIEQEKGSEPVSFGIRDDRIEIRFQFNREKGKNSFSILFPRL